MGELIQYISIILEIVIVLVGIAITIKKKKLYGLGIALTFGIYVVYDLINMSSVKGTILYISFLIATISALWVVLSIYKEGKKK